MNCGTQTEITEMGGCTVLLYNFPTKKQRDWINSQSRLLAFVNQAPREELLEILPSVTGILGCDLSFAFVKKNIYGGFRLANHRIFLWVCQVKRRR